MEWPSCRRCSTNKPAITANLSNPSTRRAYENAMRDFMGFTGIRPAGGISHRDPRAHHRLARRAGAPRAWRQHDPAPARVARLAVRISLRARTPSPITRSKASSGRGRKAAKARRRRSAITRRASCSTRPQDDTIKSKRDRAILSTLLFHALRREELCKLKVKDFRHARKGVPHLKVSGKGGKTRYLPLHPGTNALINDYLDAAGHGADENGALFRPIRNNRTGRLERRDHGGRHLQAGAAPTRRSSGSRSARMRCARPPPPMRSITRPTSPRCRNGSATPTSPPRASTITAARGRRTARRSRWLIDGRRPDVKQRSPAARRKADKAPLVAAPPQPISRRY